MIKPYVLAIILACAIIACICCMSMREGFEVPRDSWPKGLTDESIVPPADEQVNTDYLACNKQTKPAKPSTRTPPLHHPYSLPVMLQSLEEGDGLKLTSTSSVRFCSPEAQMQTVCGGADQPKNTTSYNLDEWNDSFKKFYEDDMKPLTSLVDDPDSTLIQSQINEPLNEKLSMTGMADMTDMADMADAPIQPSGDDMAEGFTNQTRAPFPRHPPLLQ